VCGLRGQNEAFCFPRSKGLTARQPDLSLEARLNLMADNNPNLPTGGVPPKPPEAPKVQPKKETVRISLPPKPTATIKLPTLPPGGPPPATASGVVAPPPATGAPAAPRPPVAGAPPPPPPPTAGAPASSVARPAAAAASTARPAPVAPAAKAKKAVSGLDVGLAIAAAVIGLGAVGYLFLGILQMN